jgi:glycosyltransferase involved in cell wall biosynthesis
LPIKVGFALLSSLDEPAPSTRIACLNLFPHLRRKGFEPEIVFEPSPETAREIPDVGDLVEKAVKQRCGIVVFQKIHGPSVLDAVTALRRAGIRTIYCVCDLVDNDMVAATDATIAVTGFLKSLYRVDLQSRIHVVHDGIERPELVHDNAKCRDPRPRTGTLTAVVVTSHEMYALPVVGFPPSGWRVDVVGFFPRSSDHIARLRRARWAVAASPRLAKKISLISAMMHPRIRHIAWDPDGVYERLLESDIGIIPVDTSCDGIGASGTPAWRLKSENRLTLKMAIGLPVIATPIPSYEAIIDHGRNGFFARSRRDWEDCFRRLRDPELRRDVGRRARQSVLGHYSVETQANLFVDVLHRVVARPPSAAADQIVPR